MRWGQRYRHRALRLFHHGSVVTLDPIGTSDAPVRYISMRKPATTMERSPTRYQSLKEFYPYYLSEHQHPVSRILHFTGTGLIAVWIILAITQRNAWWLFLVPVGGYAFAWVGHFFFEKNKPATFQYPGYSLASDFILFWHLLTGKERFNPAR